MSLGSGERPSLEAAQKHPEWAWDERLRRLVVAGAADLAQLIAADLGNRTWDHTVWESPDDWLEPGKLTLSSGRELYVVDTPGHTRGHIVLHDPHERLLFAGDHVLPTITPSIGLERMAPQNPLGDYLASLARVRLLPDAVLLPGHGPVVPSVHTRIDELVHHHRHRLDQIEMAVERGADTAFAVAGQLRWTRLNRNFSDLDSFDQVLAVIETAAHLDLLVAQEKVVEALDDGIYWYSSSSYR